MIDAQTVKFDRGDSVCAIGCGQGAIEVVELYQDLRRYQLLGHNTSVNAMQDGMKCDQSKSTEKLFKMVSVQIVSSILSLVKSLHFVQLILNYHF